MHANMKKDGHKETDSRIREWVGYWTDGWVDRKSV